MQITPESLKTRMLPSLPNRGRWADSSPEAPRLVKLFSGDNTHNDIPAYVVELHRPHGDKWRPKEGEPRWSPNGWRVEVTQEEIVVGSTTIPVMVLRGWWL